MNRRLLLAIGVAIGGLAGVFLLLLPLRTPLNPYDEGLALVNALRVYQGEVPFRDYWAIYPPGQSYALAAAFHLGEINVFTERLYDSVVRWLCALVLLGLALRVQRSWLAALITYGLCLILLAAATFYGYAMFPALLFGFGALLLFFTYLQQATGRWLIAAGLLIGVTALFRIDVAVYVGVATIAGLTAFHLAGPFTTPRTWRPTYRRWWSSSATLLGAALIPFLPFYGFLAWVSPMGEMVNNLLLFPATTFHEVRRLPYPTLLPTWERWQERSRWLEQVDWLWGEWLRFYLPLLVYTLVALVLIGTGWRLLRKRQPVPINDIQALVLLVVGLGLFVQAMSRYDAIHALPTSLPTLLLVGWLWQRCVAAPWWRPYLGLLLGLLLIVPLFLYGYLPAAKLFNLLERFPPTQCHTTVVRASCVPLVNEQAAVLDFLARQGSPASALFIGVNTHDRIFINDVSLYFLAEHPIATRYHELHPGVATTLAVQEEIVQTLIRQEVPWIILADWGNPNEPNASAHSSGVTHLDEYIRAHYTRIQQFGIYQLWQRQTHSALPHSSG
ncbi:MAG: hypothetical protein KF832_03425 [Caldilineaceae bacterium]|nr:hypothetical protein [Caldilineaceae bacterium]